MLKQLFEGVVESRKAVKLTSHNDSAVLISWDAWREIEETLFRLSTPNLDQRGR